MWWRGNWRGLNGSRGNLPASAPSNPPPDYVRSPSPRCARGGLPRLPGADRVARGDEHDDVQSQIVADRGEGAELEQDRQRHRPLDREPPRDGEAEDHPAYVGDRVDHAVAGVAERRRLLPVAVDDEAAVLQNLPTRLDQDCADQPVARGIALQEQPAEE